MSTQTRLNILKEFNTIGDKEQQDKYSAGLITSQNVQRQRPKTGVGLVRNVLNRYKLHMGCDTVKVCKKAFASIHGISLKRIQNITKHVGKDGNITPPHIPPKKTR